MLEFLIKRILINPFIFHYFDNASCDDSTYAKISKAVNGTS